MNIMKEAHRLTKEIKKEFKEVDYKAQLGICISYLSKKGEIKMESAIEKLENIIEQIVTARGFFEETMITRNKWEKKNNDGTIKISRTYIKISFRKNLFQYYINNLTNEVYDENNIIKSISKEFKEKVFTFIKENSQELILN